MSIVIGILDDEACLRESTRRSIESAVGGKAQVQILQNKDLTGSLNALRSRRETMRSGETVAPTTTTCFDDLDVLVVDYDLSGLHDGFEFLTGEDVSYLVRLCCQCKVIVALNELGTSRFDLDLEARLESYADYHVGSDTLGCSAFWFGAHHRFDPTEHSTQPADIDQLCAWSWYGVFEDIGNWPAREQMLNSHEDVASVLDVPSDIFSTLPFDALEWLDPLGAEDKGATRLWRHILTSRMGLRLKDQHEQLRHSSGLAGSPWARSFVIARLAKWLRNGVLVLQDQLQDAPHLAVEFPGMFDPTGDRPVSEWTSELVQSRAPHWYEPVKSELDNASLLKTSLWVNRPCWNMVRLRDAARNLTIKWPKRLPVFLEDTSQFQQRPNAGESASRAPRAFVPRTLVRSSTLWVSAGAQLPNGRPVRYEPRIRLYT